MSKKNASKPTEPGVSIPKADQPNAPVLILIPIEQVRIPKGKVDRTRDEAFKAGIAELAASIGTAGLINPITVLGAGAPEAPSYTLVAGERRLLACKELHWKEIPATILAREETAVDVRAAENLQRADLNDDQKALVISEMIDRATEEHLRLLGRGRPDPSPDIANKFREEAVKAVALRIGWPAKRVRAFAFIGELPQPVRELAAAGRLSVEHCRVLSMVPDDAACISLAKRHAAGDDVAKEPMGALDDLNKEVNREMATLGRVPWDKTVEFAGGPACDKCPHNSLNRTGLFDGHGKGWAKNGQIYGTNVDFENAAESGGVCMKLKCFRAKTSAAKGAMRGAGDRIAGKLREIPVKERKAKEQTLVSEAVARNTFVLPTVFGKQVRERIKAKLSSSPAKKSGAAGGAKHVDTWNSPQAVAKRKYEDAVRMRGSDVGDLIDSAIMAKDPRYLVLVYLEFVYGGIAGKALNWHNPQTKLIPKLASIVSTILRGDANEGFEAAAKKWASKFDIFENCSTSGPPESIDAIAAAVGLDPTKLPKVPVLADFLPKPAANKSKMSAPAKAKGGKRTPGKKKAKKSKASEPVAAADGEEEFD